MTIGDHELSLFFLKRNYSICWNVDLQPMYVCVFDLFNVVIQ